MPDGISWNGDLVIFAHGYVAPQVPLAIPEDQLVLPDGTSIPGIVNGLGYAFATTSYSKNGLAVKEGVFDIIDLVNIFRSKYQNTRHVYLVGASEGALVTTLALESYANVFSAGMAICGPIGNFRRQINYWGDFRVLFDYFFPKILPPSPIKIPQDLIAGWAGTYVPAITQAITVKPLATGQLLKVSNASFDPLDPTSVGKTVLGILWYNVFATNEAQIELGGQPFDNRFRWYFGSTNDLLLNFSVQRFGASPIALSEIADSYQTSGRLMAPLIALHNTGDPIVPYWHEPLYRIKTLATGSALLYTNIPILRYGHCNITASEALVGFALMVFKGTGNPLLGAEVLLPNLRSQLDYLNLARQQGAIP
jgi:pimeloyl-ACP methyl ester carboxylesterase